MALCYLKISKYRSGRSGSIYLNRQNEQLTLTVNTFLYKKQVDWSLLTDGFTLPVALHPLLKLRSDLRLDIGEKRPITIVLDGKMFKAQLINSNFDREKFPGHKEIIQIRYSPQSTISQYFRQIFAKSYSDISAQKAAMAKRMAAVSETPEFFCLYATDTPNVFAGEAFSADDLKQETPLIRKISEQEWETAVNAIDSSARIVELEKIVKLRRLDRSIAEGLKALYEYRCQICGCSFKIPYGSNLIHAHHIDSFTRSLNNNPENIMILCPNHHGVVHDTHPIFNIKNKAFHYPNGLVEPLKINLHL